MSFPSQYDSSGLSSLDQLEQDIRGSEICLSCMHPDGRVFEVKVNGGQDVAYAKSVLSKLIEVPYYEFGLRFRDSGKILIDPLSFNDFKELEGNKFVQLEIILDN